MRNYKTRAVWGGDLDCEHHWVEVGGVKTEAAVKVGPNSVVDGKKTEPRDLRSAYCSKCNAWAGQFGLEPTYWEYLEHVGIIAKALDRVVEDEGSVFWVVADTYMDKDLLGIPEATCKVFERNGWIVWGQNIWHKPNHLPSSVRDRLANSYEFVLHFVKSPNHYCSHRNVLDKDILNTFGFRISKKVAEGFKLPRNKYLVNFDRFSLDLGKDCTHSLPYRLSVNTKPFKGAHYAVYPLGILVNPFMMTTKPGDLVLDPFVGSGSTMHAAKLMGRKSIGIDINADYEPLVKQRLALAETALKDGV